MSYALPLASTASDALRATGAKALNLARLTSAGLPVPPAFAVPFNALEDSIRASNLTAPVQQHLRNLQACPTPQISTQLDRLHATIDNLAILSRARQDIVNAYLDLGAASVCVRSSSSLEDRADVSFAGQHDSIINVRGEAALFDAIRAVWRSLWSERAVHYLRQLEIPLSQLRMGVVVQTLVPAELSGVMFSVDPVGSHDRIVISAARGLGESTVSGSVVPEQITLQRLPLQLLHRRAGNASHSVQADAGGGTHSETLIDPEALVMDDALALRAGDLALQVESLFDYVPQDIEFAVASGELQLLQARPLRVVSHEVDEWQSPVSGANWRRNWRLGEWLPGPVTPLFASTALPRLCAAREEFGTGALGWRLAPSFSMPKPWFCILNGYFYTRTDFPGFDRARASPEERAAELGRHVRQLNRWRDELLPAYLIRFEQHKAFDASAATCCSLLEQLDTLIAEAGEFWYFIAPIGYGFEEMGFRPWYERKLPEVGRPHFSVLLSGYPSRLLDAQQALWSIADALRNDQATVQQIREADGRMLDQLPANVQQALRTWVEAYGHQLTDLDFNAPTQGESVATLLQSLTVFLSTETQSPESRRLAAAGARARAEQWARVALAEGSQDRENLEMNLVRFQANAAVREDANFYFQLGWPQMRRIAAELGRRLLGRAVIADVNDIYFLDGRELTRLADSLDNNQPVTPMISAIALRRERWQLQNALQAPDSLGEQQGPAQSGRGYINDEQGERIVGNAASPGRAEGTVRIIRNVSDAMNFGRGDILVTAVASPSLTPLLLVAGALVVEVGGGASHSSLLARELGLPAVVSATGATTTMRDGQRARVEADSGIVWLL